MGIDVRTGSDQNQTNKMKPHMEYFIQLWSPQYRKNFDLFEHIQRWSAKMIRGVEHLCYEERLRELGLFSLEKRRLWEDLIAAFQCLKEDRLFSRACCIRTGGNGFKIKEGGFRLDIRKKFFVTRVMKHWNSLPEEVVGAASLETFKARLYKCLSEQPDLVRDVSAHCRGLGVDDL